jgi:hypothetical protein
MKRRFYLEWLKRAFSGWFKRVEGWAGTVALLLGIVFLFVSAPGGMRDSLENVPSLFFLLAFGAVVLYRLLLAPYWIYRDEWRAREAAEAARRPQLTIPLPDPPVLNSIHLKGATTQSPTGSRQTVISEWALDVLAPVCTNVGEVTARGCRARLLEALRLGADGHVDLRLVKSIELAWQKEDPEAFLCVDIAPSESRRVWIGHVREGGQLWLHRDFRRLPLEYQQLIGEAGTYELLIQLDGESIPPQQIRLRVVAAEGPKPYSGIHRGTAEIEIVAQGSPRIEPAQLR